MDIISFILVIIIIFILGLYIYLNGKPGANEPPGPWRLPLLGNVTAIGGPGSHLIVQTLSEKYGRIVGLKLGPMKMVILSDAKDVKEAFSLPTFTGKSDLETFTVFSGGKYGIINSDGDTWVEQRRFTIRHLRDLGFGKSYMEDLIMEEVNEFMAWLKSEEGMPISLETRFSMAVLNSIWMLLHGHRYRHDDPRLQELFQKNQDAGAAASSAGILFLLPSLAKLLPNLSGYQKMMDLVQGFRDFFQESIQEHEAMLEEDDGGAARDLVEAYLMEMKKKKGSQSSFNEFSGMKNLMAMISDMFIAGHETTSATLQWLFLYVTRDPRVQAKLHEELDKIVGNARRPTLTDRPALIYTEAVILETLRISSIIPLGVPHTLAEDVEFRGYKLAKGSLIMPNIWAIHHDANIWKQPDEFIPERFISPDGASIIKNDQILPFSVGKRACVGELMARNELFLFTTNIFHRFNVKFDPSLPVPSTEAGLTFILAPKPFKVIMTERIK